MKIGMRNIKTAISVAICVVIFKTFNLGTPFYAAVAAIIAMQSSVRDSFSAGKNRILGTLVGAFVGFIFALIKPGDPILIGLGIIILIYLSNLLHWNKSITIAGVVFIAIMVNLGDKSPIEYSLFRILDTIIGISVSVLVNYLIVPPNSLNKTLEDCRLLVDKNRMLIKEVLCPDDIAFDELSKEVKTLLNKIEHSIEEMRPSRAHSNSLETAKSIIDLSDRISKYLDIIFIMRHDGVLNEENSENLEAICRYSPEKKDYTGDETSVVYNYHVRNILEDMSELETLVTAL